MNKIRRDWLKRQVQKDNMICKSDYHFTDDYKNDLAENFGKTNWLPCRIRENIRDWKQGYINLTDFDFEAKSGTAYKENGFYHLIVHSNKALTLKFKE